ncbi:UDP-glucose 4-epimerase GalE [Rhodoferax saidenbachensis]|uniref:UDP-glucose 4-epimerase n=1 Tax=Rhodoferax saidenbachensis TaxID=1484693 RepID=A0ABU1ZM17_9BURK|nr:UDP-glucose 4-epimerase GalE [Rhodoferax saidenbachensis]MDR7305611.1 UDP-glucose 4-epimerase [Rhodoferax saidenbachensis]
MIFVTGGAGYIGSHTCVELLNAGMNVTVYDNFSNSEAEAIERVRRITGKAVQVIQGDIRDRVGLEQALRQSGAKAVVHFAGLKAVGESEAVPLTYYDNNVVGTLRLLEAMQACGVKNLVFSSSATVYGVPENLPYTEDHRLSATNTYGTTKLVIENMLRDLHRSDATWRIAVLRYFNPVGAHPTGLMGEDPQGVPNNLMPYVAQVAVGRRTHLSVWGNDYPTPDGTGVRDYIHVVDLAIGHVKAIQYLEGHSGCEAINLGAGVGSSVLDLVQAFEAASGKSIPYEIGPRRAGDLDAYWADASRAVELLGWRAERSLAQMCEDTWRWQEMNPNGYKGGN